MGEESTVSDFFELMSGGQRIAMVSWRPTPQPQMWAYEVRYTGKSPQRGTFSTPETEHLQLASLVLEDYFIHHHASVSS